jgi:hypothetical protein
MIILPTGLKQQFTLLIKTKAPVKVGAFLFNQNRN